MSFSPFGAIFLLSLLCYSVQLSFFNIMSVSKPIGDISHLVEAATALTKLVDVGPYQSRITPAVIQPKIQGHTILPNTVVSDDEDSKRTSSASVNLRTNVSSSSKEIFPQRLMQVLADTSLGDVISWLPHGRSFVIIRPDVFSERVLPKYFPSNDTRSSSKYPSFTRKLNRWGFRQATRGPDTGAFHHPLFRRDQPHLCLDMVCQKSRKRSSSSNKGDKNRSLPQKDALKDTVSLTKEALETLPGSWEETNRAVSTVSVDDPSESGTGKSVASMAANKQRQLVSLSPWVPNNPTLVASALRAREEQERFAVARTMLYEAYMKALQS
jgi:hypothetical protein